MMIIISKVFEWARGEAICSPLCANLLVQQVRHTAAHFGGRALFTLVRARLFARPSVASSDPLVKCAPQVGSVEVPKIPPLISPALAQNCGIQADGRRERVSE